MNCIPAPGFYSFWIKPFGAGIFFWFLLSKPLLADIGDYPAGARSAALANAAVSVSDGWCTFHNQAGLGFLSSSMAGLYFENRFLVKEMSMQAGTMSLHVKSGGLGISYRFFGYSKYNESKFGLAYGHKFTKRFAAGVQLNYLQTHISEGYANYHTLAAEVGVMSQPVDHLYIGAHVFNPTMVKNSAIPQEKVPTIFRIGLCYQLDEKALFLFETEKDMALKPAYKAGIEVQAVDHFSLRGGFSTLYEKYSFGLGYHFHHLIADMAFSRHEILGFTPHISLSYEF